jgi:hypothetical protein
MTETLIVRSKFGSAEKVASKNSVRVGLSALASAASSSLAVAIGLFQDAHLASNDFPPPTQLFITESRGKFDDGTEEHHHDDEDLEDPMEIDGDELEAEGAKDAKVHSVTFNDNQFSQGRLHPLQIPEILLHIFSFLESPLNTGTDPTQPLDFVKVDSIKYSVAKPKLHSCVLVCKLWNACATPLLWRNIKIGSDSGCQHLARTLSSELRRNKPFTVEHHVFLMSKLII